ncbi:putative glycosyl hydrolase [Halocynthia phage JM-2012]|uniref:putative glycosyl hydrolase n=1 Tax=Halocynthia phage JM-2012 TaxID=1173297 RepID=UPI00025C68F7|nr:putative glycosyl hydrolase [Halocynthia phage JM-2012]AFI55323.1 putative glycosyl hydrolase [Halocynthia phage JM-2012]
MIDFITIEDNKLVYLDEVNGISERVTDLRGKEVTLDGCEAVLGLISIVHDLNEIIATSTGDMVSILDNNFMSIGSVDLTIYVVVVTDEGKYRLCRIIHNSKDGWSGTWINIVSSNVEITSMLRKMYDCDIISLLKLRSVLNGDKSNNIKTIDLPTLERDYIPLGSIAKEEVKLEFKL